MSACPFCGAAWVPARSRRQYDLGVIVRIRATCPGCAARVDAAGHGAELETAVEMAAADFAARCAARVGTRREAWNIPAREARGLTRRAP